MTQRGIASYLVGYCKIGVSPERSPRIELYGRREQAKARSPLSLWPSLRQALARVSKAFPRVRTTVAVNLF